MEWYEKLAGVGVIIFLAFLIMRGCSTQNMARSWGGEMEISLEPNQKLLEVTWKENSLWLLTKEMEDSDTAETYDFYEKSPMGMIEGSVKIHEKKLSKEELEEYQHQAQYAKDYYNSSNYDGNGKEVFIQYQTDTDTYSLLEPYKYNEHGELVPQNQWGDIK